VRLIYKQAFLPIKVISTAIILSGVGLELWNIATNLTDAEIPSYLHVFFWFERFAMTAHLMEATVAAYFASRKNQTPWKYAAYTFFVGTVGLLELFESESEQE
jgi:hypothetical protein